MDAKRLLAEATAETLRKDAKLLQLAAMCEPRGSWMFAMLRLAALGEAVAALDARPSLLHREDGDWDEDHHHPGYWRVRILGTMEYTRDTTLPAALSTLLPTEDTTNE